MKLINVFGDFFTARFAVSATALFASFRASIDDVVNLGRASPCLSIFQKKTTRKTNNFLIIWNYLRAWSGCYRRWLVWFLGPTCLKLATSTPCGTDFRVMLRGYLKWNSWSMCVLTCTASTVLLNFDFYSKLFFPKKGTLYFPKGIVGGARVLESNLPLKLEDDSQIVFYSCVFVRVIVNWQEASFNNCSSLFRCNHWFFIKESLNHISFQPSYTQLNATIDSQCPNWIVRSS